MTTTRIAIFLSGPISPGKSTFGRALALALDGVFVEGDEHSVPDKPWFMSTLSTARSITRSIVAHSACSRPVVVAMPLRCIDWVFYRDHLHINDIRVVVVSLRATYESIKNAARGRQFSNGENTRIRQMIAQGYYRRAFSDLVLHTDRESARETLGRLILKLKPIIGQDC